MIKKKLKDIETIKLCSSNVENIAHIFETGLQKKERKIENTHLALLDVLINLKKKRGIAQNRKEILGIHYHKLPVGHSSVVLAATWQKLLSF